MKKRSLPYFTLLFLACSANAKTTTAAEWVARASVADGNEFYMNKVLSVPPAINYGGTFPTCAAMVLMYHNDTLGIFPEGVDNFLMQEAKDLIASPSHLATFAADPSCIAGATKTSDPSSGLGAGQSFLTAQGSYAMSGMVNGGIYSFNVSPYGAIYGLELFINNHRDFSISEAEVSVANQWYGERDIWGELSTPAEEVIETTWNEVVEKIDAGHPYIGVTNDSYLGVQYVSRTVTICGYATDGVNRAIAYYTGSSWEVNWRFVEDNFLQGEVVVDFSLEGGLKDGVVHRFYRADTGAYFFTASKEEAQNVINMDTVWKYQNPVFKVEYGKTDTNLPVFRFYNKRAGAHFFTMSAAEKEQIIANLSGQFSYEGIAFYCSPSPRAFDPAHPEIPANYPIYRCYLPKTSSHYFTGSKSEIDYINQNVDPSQIRVEGIAWYSDMVYDKL